MNKKISLVLSGGGARGIAHIGVIEELERQGFEIVSIAGTSMGALVAGAYAVGKLQEFKEWMISLDKMKVFKLVDFTLSRQGLVKGDKVFNRMKDFMPDSNIEDLPIPFCAVAVDIKNKKEVVFTNGSLYKAIRASVSIPTVFTPVKTTDGLLVDGGVMNNIPINRVKHIEGSSLIAVDVNANIPIDKPKISKKEKEENHSVYQKKLNEFYAHIQKINPLSSSTEETMGYFDVINKTINLMTHNTALLLLKHHEPELMIEISGEVCGIFDFYRAAELVEIGKFAAMKSLKNSELIKA
jgi:NTE family protein